MPVGPGTIGITRAPGPTHLDAIAAWRPIAVITLVEPHELDELGLSALAAEMQSRDIAWHHWPIQDYGIPDAAFDAEWPERSTAIRHLLAAGARILIHCRGGLGRSGTIAARLLIDYGTPPDTAIATVRTARPGAIETAAQEAWASHQSA